MIGRMRAALAAMAMGLLMPLAAPAQPATPAVATPAQPEAPAVAAPAQPEAPAVAAPVPTAAPKVDLAAKLFLGRCAGCHTVGGGPLTGPDLLPATQRARPELWATVKRMEANAGPLKDEQVDELTDMLRSGQARERLQAQQRLLEAASAVTLSAPSVTDGEALFHGSRRLAAGGPSCVSCHAVGGIGGSLGLDLSTVGTRLSEVALRSAIEKPSFRVMRPIYEARPITAQEALNITAYLQKAAAEGGHQSEPPVALFGLATAGGILALLALYGRQRAAGTRRRLVQKAQER